MTLPTTVTDLIKAWVQQNPGQACSGGPRAALETAVAAAMVAAGVKPVNRKQLITIMVADQLKKYRGVIAPNSTRSMQSLPTK